MAAGYNLLQDSTFGPPGSSKLLSQLLFGQQSNHLGQTYVQDEKLAATDHTVQIRDLRLQGANEWS